MIQKLLLKLPKVRPVTPMTIAKAPGVTCGQSLTSAAVMRSLEKLQRVKSAKRMTIAKAPGAICGLSPTSAAVMKLPLEQNSALTIVTAMNSNIAPAQDVKIGFQMSLVKLPKVKPAKRMTTVRAPGATCGLFPMSAAVMRLEELDGNVLLVGNAIGANTAV